MVKAFTRITSLFALIVILASCKTYHAAEINVGKTRIDTTLTDVDAEMAAFIEPYREKLEAKMNAVLCRNMVNMEKGKPESTLTNWFADALYAATLQHYDMDVDFAIQNYGGIRRSSVGKGDITVGTVYELMPFDNEMIILELDSTNVQTLCDRMATSGGWPVSKELRFVIANNKANDITIQGEPLTDKVIYHAMIPDYIANGGDGLKFLMDLKRYRNGVLIRDGLLQYLDGAPAIEAVQLDGRITIE